MILRSGAGGRRVPVLIVMHERAVVHRIGEDFGFWERFVHHNAPNTPVDPNAPL
jgi:hypothetical protein